MIKDVNQRVASMTTSEAKRIVRSMLLRSKDIECTDYDMFTQAQYVALMTLVSTGTHYRYYQLSDD